MLSPLFAAERRFELRALYPFAACLIAIAVSAVLRADWWGAGFALWAMLLNGKIGISLEKNRTKSFRQYATELGTPEQTSTNDLTASDIRTLSRNGFEFATLVAAVAVLICYRLKQSWWFTLVIAAAGYFISIWWWYVVAVSQSQWSMLQTIKQSAGGELIGALGWKRKGGELAAGPSPQPSAMAPAITLARANETTEPNATVDERRDNLFGLNATQYKQAWTGGIILAALDMYGGTPEGRKERGRFGPVGGPDPAKWPLPMGLSPFAPISEQLAFMKVLDKMPDCEQVRKLREFKLGYIRKMEADNNSKEIYVPPDCPNRNGTLDDEFGMLDGGYGMLNGYLWREDLSNCCRRACMNKDNETLCVTINSEDEVYRFFWDSSFDGNAVVRIGRRDSKITLRWRYDSFRELAADDSPKEKALSAGDWSRLLDALMAANFWSIDSADNRMGLDGAQWLIEGRRGNVYRGLSRWSPDDEVYCLGRSFFHLAGPPLSRMRLY